MKTIIIAGGSGTVGSRLAQILKTKEYKTLVLTRNKEKCTRDSSFIYWDVENGEVDNRITEADSIINLAGSGIADGRWTNKRKEEIMSSRVDSTRLLISSIKNHSIPLESYISASAIGYYGDGGTQLLTEESDVITKEFLSDVCVRWEEEAHKAKSLCPSFSIIRIGTVLSKQGGALEKMDKSIPYGIASYLGSGDQLMSWIHIDDLCHMITFLLEKRLSGIYNGVAPEVLSNKEFTKILRNTVNPKALLVGTPSLALKLALGEMSRVVLNNSNISAQKILKSGFSFKYPTLRNALDDLYKK